MFSLSLFLAICYGSCIQGSNETLTSQVANNWMVSDTFRKQIKGGEGHSYNENESSVGRSTTPRMLCFGAYLDRLFWNSLAIDSLCGGQSTASLDKSVIGNEFTEIKHVIVRCGLTCLKIGPCQLWYFWAQKWMATRTGVVSIKVYSDQTLCSKAYFCTTLFANDTVYLKRLFKSQKIIRGLTARNIHHKKQNLSYPITAFLITFSVVMEKIITARVWAWPSIIFGCCGEKPGRTMLRQKALWDCFSVTSHRAYLRFLKTQLHFTKHRHWHGFRTL